MKSTKPSSLIAAQDAHINRLLGSTPYTLASRLERPHTLLNLKVRTIRASRRIFRGDLRELGYVDLGAINVALKDAEDMAILEGNADG